ncbi:MAG: type II toxin-antitoxin system HicB family antitoxin [Candidatus Electryonea clarkiae]|nr:type II toxin-antitoxin system HicB family antitoxin [Candidatus Electryonea clarkiae]MDP8285247.1 type II toxin-antitoxin system HicB family antitoxin [Candidatus Electryonea clarkiae]
MTHQFTAIIEREENQYVALCPEFDLISQGDSVESARENLRETLELFSEFASPKEIKSRINKDIIISHIEVELE